MVAFPPGGDPDPQRSRPDDMAALTRRSGWHRPMTIRQGLMLTAAAMVCVAAYLTGIYQGYERERPAQWMRKIYERDVNSRQIRTDEFGRLLRYPGKISVACPPQDQDSAVLLVFGQSNAANFQGQRYQGVDARVVNFSDGRCYLASSPLLGADGKYGESWTLLGNQLISAGLYRTVILVPAGVGSSSVRQWAAGGDLNAMLLRVVRQIQARYTITALLWQQGATDFAQHTSEERYKAGMMSLINSLREAGVGAPFYVSTSSLQLVASWSPDNPITRAQKALVDGRSILAGPNTDRDVLAMDRYDGLHFSASGQEKFANAWLALLRASRIAKQAAK